MATQRAVSDYQQAAGLAVTGTADAALQARIQSDNTLVGTARRLTLKSKGVVVKALEEKLKALGLFPGTPDTLYDKVTRQAVASYQRQQGLTPNGVATGSLQQSIFAQPLPGQEEAAA